MKKSSLLLYLFTLVLLQSTLTAQSNDQQEYIVLNTSDTLYGNVEHINEKGAGRSFHEKIRLTTLNGKTKKYKREDIAAFKIDNTNYESYRLIQLSNKVQLINPLYNIDSKEGEQHFFRVVTKGKLSHYELEWFEQGESALWSMAVLKKGEDRFFIRADQGLLGLKRKVLSSYFSDCLGLIEAMDSKKLTNVSEVIDYYNDHCID